MKPYYYILNTSRIYAPTIRHATLADALRESERLAKKHPGDHFEVLKCVAISHIPKPTITFFLDK